MANNHAKNNINCFQHRKVDKYSQNTFNVRLIIMDLFYKVSRRHCSSRLEYKASERDTIAPEPAAQWLASLTGKVPEIFNKSYLMSYRTPS